MVAKKPIVPGDQWFPGDEDKKNSVRAQPIRMPAQGSQREISIIYGIQQLDHEQYSSAGRRYCTTEVPCAGPGRS